MLPCLGGHLIQLFSPRPMLSEVEMLLKVQKEAPLNSKWVTLFKCVTTWRESSFSREVTESGLRQCSQ